MIYERREEFAVSAWQSVVADGHDFVAFAKYTACENFEFIKYL